MCPHVRISVEPGALWYMEMVYCGPDALTSLSAITLQWRHNGHDGVSNHQPYDCLLNCLFRRRSNKTSKIRVTGLCEGNSPVTGEFPAQRASNAEHVAIWWRHHEQRSFQMTAALSLAEMLVTTSDRYDITGPGASRAYTTHSSMQALNAVTCPIY